MVGDIYARLYTLFCIPTQYSSAHINIAVN